MMKLLLATRNPGKRKELEALLAGLTLEIIYPEALDDLREVEETGADYAENARLKAITLAARHGLWTLADDTGLEVEALGGAPGVHSARLVGPQGTDADRRARLLELLKGHPRPWRASFRCVVALAGPQGELESAVGECAGEIIPEPRGRHGFGYDPIFLVDGQERTMAELPLEVKNRLSHRARALQALMPVLRRRLGLPLE
ncbi:MAG TPA: RdgB/HAM1 family non-canonical purine NTP pyrophosphatase [Chloroflexi bacterium]|nr:RdgB/HAM1 family non-canonical purine NTP pyrophosphatase [Chloroflexota bacterium]